MRFGYTIIYTDDVESSIAFFEKAFGIARRFVHESGYGELETGATTLAFASHELGNLNVPNGYVKANGGLPLGIEIALVVENVAQVFDEAVCAGATNIKEPVQKPWGQTVAYVRCPDGVLVEICSPIGG